MVILLSNQSLIIMILYQVKINIDPTVEKEWFHWMKTVHVPDLIATGLVATFDIWSPTDSDSPIYYFHYYFHTQEDLDNYQKNHAPKLKADVLERYPSQFTAERMILRQL